MNKYSCFPLSNYFWNLAEEKREDTLVCDKRNECCGPNGKPCRYCYYWGVPLGGIIDIITLNTLSFCIGQ